MANPATPAGPALAGPAARPNEESPWNNIISIAKVRTLCDVICCVAYSAVANVHGLGCDASRFVLRQRSVLCSLIFPCSDEIL